MAMSHEKILASVAIAAHERKGLASVEVSTTIHVESNWSVDC